MKIRIKLYATLGKYLPKGAARNETEIEVADGASPADVIRGLGMPAELCHLVLVDGNYVAPSERDATPLKEGESLAIWPPVAGG